MIIMVNLRFDRLRLLKELEKYALFTSKTVMDITGKNKKYSNLIVHRLRKAGLISRIERDKYTLHDDPLIIASSIVWPSYISGWSALQYHHLTEQIPRQIDILTSRARKKRKITFGYSQIIFTRIPPACIFGFKKEQYRGFEIFMANKEKAVADVVVFKKASKEEVNEIASKNKQR